EKTDGGRAFKLVADYEPSGDQPTAIAELVAQAEAGERDQVLLGVTGSGKTEVYFEAIAEALRMGRQTLVLLPEIALTEPFLKRFEAR
ncbi:DEAD/DEAH box helicase family protein, partial [Staphylococcus equorum]|nr:DEAD/DEAH box helicase family protein [Staphylococcus equorum]